MFSPLLLLLPLSLVQGPVQGTREAVPTTPVRPILTVECEGLDALLVDPKDRALAEALSLTGERLRDLPAEIDGLPLPPSVVPLVLRVFGSPFRLSVGAEPKGDPQNPFGVAMDLRLHKADGDEAAAIGTDLAQFLGGFGLAFADPGEDGLRRAQVPFPVWMGPSESDLVLRAGVDAGVEFHSAAELLPEGTRFAYGEQFDVGAALELLPILMQNEPADEVAMVQGLLHKFGVDELSLRVALGTNQEATVAVAHMAGVEKVLSGIGFLHERGLSQDMLRAIPADATWARVYAADSHGAFTRVCSLMEEYEPSALDDLREFESEFGISIGDDILAPLAGRFAEYGSNTTGGDMTSTVLLAELSDPDTMARTIETVKALLNQLGQKEADGYVRVVSAVDQGIRYDTLRFPGLPVPLEPTIVLDGHMLVAALNPQAARAAVRQLGGGGPSLLSNADFQTALKDQAVEGAILLGWVDTPELLTAGYGTAGVLTAMISNAVRSPQDPDRGPAFLLPEFSVLANDASPMLTIARIEDGAWVARSTCDRSQLVNVAGIAGLVYRSPLGLWVLANMGMQFLANNRDVQMMIFGEF